MRQACIQPGHDPHHVSEVSVIEHIAEYLLQEGVVVSAGLPHDRPAVPRYRCEGGTGIVGVRLSLDETRHLHAVEELR